MKKECDDSERDESNEEQLQCKKVVLRRFLWDTVSRFSFAIVMSVY